MPGENRAAEVTEGKSDTARGPGETSGLGRGRAAEVKGVDEIKEATAVEEVTGWNAKAGRYAGRNPSAQNDKALAASPPKRRLLCPRRPRSSPRQYVREQPGERRRSRQALPAHSSVLGSLGNF